MYVRIVSHKFEADLCVILAPLDKGSKMEELVTKIRTRKGLKVGY